MLPGWAGGSGALLPLGTVLFRSHHGAGCPKISLVVQRGPERLQEGRWDVVGYVGEAAGKVMGDSAATA